ncbi:hypothetical protein Cylst_3542 [Cylindrospermum stagnale PCC 7417]|uniref:Uncharacterized protein n=1 Tax=Cylindrospermum stagnale PCC 7417 TaxID=56107 RepID=K9WZ91_9NOST|nr:hypothetical protein Cylst_3542 [Cylindrospermum stagnale PCC 7417]
MKRSHAYKRYNWDELIRLWSEIELGNTPSRDTGKA